MEKATYRITLDVNSSAVQARLPMRRGDTARQIIISLTEGGKPLSVSDTDTVQFYASRPDEKQVIGTAANGDCRVENGCIVYTLQSAVTALAGVVPCEVLVLDSDKLTPPKFEIVVYDTVFDENAAAPDGEADDLRELLAELEALAEEVGTFEDGKTPELKSEGKTFYWKYTDEDDTAWRELVTVVDGATPQMGVDYFTEEDKAEMVDAVLAALPNGDEVSY